MRIGALAAAFVLLCAWQGSAMAQTSQEERIRKLEQRIRYLENRVGDQDKAIVNKSREAKEEQADKWFSKVEVTGAIELEVTAGKDFEGASSTGLDLATADVGVAAQVHDWVSGEVVLTWNGDDEKVEVDTATVTVQQPDSMFSMTGGILYVPFGTFETNLISDPLTLDIGEARETALQFDMEAGGITASAFVFKGANDRGGRDRIGNFGFAFGYAYEGAFNLGLNASYINDIGESDGVTGGFDDAVAAHEEAVAGVDEDANIGETANPQVKSMLAMYEPTRGNRAIPGAHISAMASYGPVSLTAEYVTALKAFQSTELGFRTKEVGVVADGSPVNGNDGQQLTIEVPRGGAKPSAWAVEAALTFEMMKSEVTAAAGYQQTKQAVGLGLPESRYLIGVSVGIVEGVSVAGEVAFDKDYSEANGGTGENATAFTLQFAAEF